MSSELTQWPVQISLVPESVPFLKGADILIASDCVPVAYPGFHQDLLSGKKILLGCPKLDDSGAYIEKLAGLFKESKPKSITIAIMEVPCCAGMKKIVEEALAGSGLKIAVKIVTVGIKGDLK
jgi:hypothetical protein